MSLAVCHLAHVTLSELPIGIDAVHIDIAATNISSDSAAIALKTHRPRRFTNGILDAQLPLRLFKRAVRRADLWLWKHHQQALYKSGIAGGIDSDVHA